MRVEAARIARGYGVRLAEEDGTLAAKVRTFILDQAADSPLEQEGPCVSESESLELLDGA